MLRPRALPDSLPVHFHVAEAVAHGVSLERMRRSDLARPFSGVRSRAVGSAALEHPDEFARRAHDLRMRAYAYAPRLREGQFFSHETAAALWNAPLPWHVFEDPTPPVHVSVFGTAALPRLEGVIGHRARRETSIVREIEGLPIASPATTWASLGTLALYDIIALGDYFCREWREGVGRPSAGRPTACDP